MSEAATTTIITPEMPRVGTRAVLTLNHYDGTSDTNVVEVVAPAGDGDVDCLLLSSTERGNTPGSIDTLFVSEVRSGKVTWESA